VTSYLKFIIKKVGVDELPVLEMKVLVRAKCDRCLESGEHLWGSFDNRPVSFTYSVDLPYARNDTANFEVKFSTVNIVRSSHKKNINNSAKYIRNLTALYLKEIDPHRTASLLPGCYFQTRKLIQKNKLSKQ